MYIYIAIAAALAALYFFAPELTTKNYIRLDRRRVANLIDRYNSSAESEVIADKLLRYCRKYDINPWVVLAMIQGESNFETEEPGKAGEYGLMQVKPKALEQVYNTYPNELHEYYEPYLEQIGYNIQVGILYLQYCLERADGNIKTALAYYNGGFKKPNYDYAEKVFDTVQHMKQRY